MKVTNDEYAPIAGVSFDRDREEIKYWDSLCNAENVRAKKDIKSNKLFYTHVFGMVQGYKSDVEMDSLLSKFGISTRENLYFCTVPINKQNCYGKIMNAEISKRFGSKFIDSLRNEADKIFVKKHQNDIFRFEDCDMNSRYAKSNDYNEALELVQNDFWKETAYPEDFYFRKEKDLYSSMEAYFTLYKTGEISEPSIEMTFQNEVNYQYSSYFMEKLKTFITKSKWKTATMKGIPVNSEMHVLIFFK